MSSEIQCICADNTDDGLTIQCDNCLIWQHCLCVGLTLEQASNLSTYLCNKCRDLVLQESAHLLTNQLLETTAINKKGTRKAAVFR